MTAPQPQDAAPKPCPFCGAEMVSHFAGVWGHPDEPSDCWSASVLAIAPAMLDRWNRRAPSASEAALREALAEMVTLVDDLSVGVGQMALRDYRLFNEAPIRARAALASTERAGT
jgi:hypothetical protein